VLVGSGNPEEGELRPQLLDRFGLSVDVRTPTDLRAARSRWSRRRDAFERDPVAFLRGLAKDARCASAASIVRARRRLHRLEVPDARAGGGGAVCASRWAPTACAAN
jgi:magnesium chelatase subunit I